MKKRFNVLKWSNETVFGVVVLFYVLIMVGCSKLHAQPMRETGMKPIKGQVSIVSQEASFPKEEYRHLTYLQSHYMVFESVDMLQYSIDSMILYKYSEDVCTYCPIAIIYKHDDFYSVFLCSREGFIYNQYIGMYKQSDLSVSVTIKNKKKSKS